MYDRLNKLTHDRSANIDFIRSFREGPENIVFIEEKGELVDLRFSLSLQKAREFLIDDVFVPVDE